jgi:hypothetical protein
MRKYTAAPKDIADALRASIPVSDAAALGDDWKKLPVGQSTRPKTGKRAVPGLARRVSLSKKKAVHSRSPKVKTDSIEFNFGGVRMKVQGTPSASYAKDLAKAIKDYIKKHPVKA